MRRCFDLLVLFLLGGCSAMPSETVIPSGAALVGSESNGCCWAKLRVYDEAPGVTERLYVEVGTTTTAATYGIDTGSAISYRRQAAAAASSSCVFPEFRLEEGLGEDATPDGVPLAGTLGSDLLAGGSAFDLRIAEGRFAWIREPAPLPSGAVHLPATFHVSSDPYASNTLTVTGVKLDGVEGELLVDTGSPHVLILSDTPRPNEEVLQTTDGNGEPVTLYVSTIEVSFGEGPAHRVPLDRAAHFPSLEQTFTAIGGGVRGILGLSGLGHDRVVLSKTSVAFIPPR
jgi:hypothetical protein